ncbi:hypothetical protein S245_043467, partial [Arachis hypogaea]
KKFGVNEFVNPKDHNKPIQEVSFTGSTETGRKVMMAATMSNLKSVSLELGGKSPVLIFDDADVDKAVDLALFGTLHNKGEICVAFFRVYVQEGIYDEFEKKTSNEDMLISQDEIFGPVMVLSKF